MSTKSLWVEMEDSPVTRHVTVTPHAGGVRIRFSRPLGLADVSMPGMPVLVRTGSTGTHRWSYGRVHQSFKRKRAEDGTMRIPVQFCQKPVLVDWFSPRDSEICLNVRLFRQLHHPQEYVVSKPEGTRGPLMAIQPR